MKRLFVLVIACCLLFGSCGVKADFVIPRETQTISEDIVSEDERISVVINKNSGKYHLKTDCIYASRMSEANRLEIKVKSEEYLREKGYTPCSKCFSEK